MCLPITEGWPGRVDRSLRIGPTLQYKSRVFWSSPRKFETVSGKKCSPGTPLSGNIRKMQIFAGVPWRRASNDSGVVQKCIFSKFVIFSESLEIKPLVHIQRHEVGYLTGFLTTLKCVTLNDLEISFYSMADLLSETMKVGPRLLVVNVGENVQISGAVIEMLSSSSSGGIGAAASYFISSPRSYLTSPVSSSPLLSSITPSFFHSKLKTFLFLKSYPP